MKLVIIFIFLLFTNSALAREVDDKLMHMGVSMMLGLASNQLLPDTMSTHERVIYGVMIGTAPGLLKEFIDNKSFAISDKSGFSWQDLLADVLGAAVGNVWSENIRLTYRSGPAPIVTIQYQIKF
jgi:hypothetical protein